MGKVLRRAWGLLLLFGLVGACINASHATGEGPSLDSGIDGVVWIGPMRPEIRGQAPRDAPFTATIVVQDHNRRDLRTVQSGQDGTFRILLPPGDYWLIPLSPRPGVPPSASPLQVRVEPHRFTRVQIYYDTGLR